jgi:uncharacterized protein (DUF2345 family)
MAVLYPNLPTAQLQDPTQRIAALEARVARLEAVLQISPVGVVTLKSNSYLNIQAGSQLEITTPGNMKILAGGQLQMKAAQIV